MRVAVNQGSLDTIVIAKCPRSFVAVDQRWRIIEWRIIEGVLYPEIKLVHDTVNSLKERLFNRKVKPVRNGTTISTKQQR